MTESDYTTSLPALFAKVVRDHASRPALRLAPGDEVTYAELDAMSSSLASQLASSHGVRTGDVVAISGDKSRECYASLVAATKLGAPYVMLDPDSPPDRIERIFATCRPRVVLGDRAFLDAIAPIAGPAALVESSTSGLDGVPGFPLLPEINGETPAYIVYTSGSTGLPKGSVMTHSCALNFVSWSRTTYGIGHEDVLTNLNPIYFDNSVFDIFSSLFVGACLVPFSKAETKDPGALVRKIDATGCTVWFSVPSLMLYLQTFRATDGKRLRSVRLFLFGGEGYPKGRLVQLHRAYGDTARIHNVYGPSECTCICSSHEVGPDDFDTLDGFPPLGKMAPNFRAIMLTDDGSVLRGEGLGELCLQGPNVGRGYWNDPERTAAAFVQNPEHALYRDVVYRTGDLVRRDAEGVLWFQGRRDNQIKHMGHRIELGEIDATLCRIPGVAEASVAYLSSQTGSGAIVAAVVAPGLDPALIRDALSKLVPSYMMPDRIEVWDALPRNANGKTDRRAVLARFQDAARSEQP